MNEEQEVTKNIKEKIIKKKLNRNGSETVF